MEELVINLLNWIDGDFVSEEDLMEWVDADNNKEYLVGLLFLLGILYINENDRVGLTITGEAIHIHLKTNV